MAGHSIDTKLLDAGYSKVCLGTENMNYHSVPKKSVQESTSPALCQIITLLHQIPLVKRHAYCDEILMKMIMPDEERLTCMSYTILYAKSLYVKSSNLSRQRAS
jgi:hypothetical protein